MSVRLTIITYKQQIPDIYLVITKITEHTCHCRLTKRYDVCWTTGHTKKRTNLPFDHRITTLTHRDTETIGVWPEKCSTFP